jgi:AAA domain
MFDRDDLYDDFEEDRLPPGQKTIMTQNIIKFRMFARKVIEAKEQTGYGLMGIATAKSGWGKSRAMLDFLDNVPRRPHTGLPTCIGIRAKPHANPRALLADLYKRLGVKAPRRLTRFNIADEAAEIIRATDLRGIFTDESDQLEADSLEFLRYVYDKTGCSVIIVGLPSIMTVIQRHEQLEGRIGHELQLLPPTVNEVLDTILPELIIPHWFYDPANEADREMGQDLWVHARSSFRELRLLLVRASQFSEDVAKTPDQARITPDILQLVYGRRSRRQISLSNQQEKKTQPDAPQTDTAKTQSDQAETQPDPPQTNFEAESEMRHDARKKKKKSGEDGEDEQ